jgi:SAM-dependent methyltransferase
MAVETTSTRANREFFERAYAPALARHALKQLVSYDQLSKTRRNLGVARRLPRFERQLSILDYGFGLGTFLLRLPRRHRISGVELSQHAVSNLQRLCRLLRRDVATYSPEQLATLPAASFDFISCSHVLEHVDNDLSLVIELHRLLKQDGYLLINVPINEVWNDPNHVRAYDVTSALALLQHGGYAVEQVHEADRWTALVLTHEHTASVVPSIAMRALRVGLALMPSLLLDLTDRFLYGYRPQQLILVATKR